MNYWCGDCHCEVSDEELEYDDNTGDDVCPYCGNKVTPMTDVPDPD